MKHVTLFFYHKDCTTTSHRLEKYQDLPTRGALDVEQFRINGGLFLAFANNNGDSEGFKTDSFIYKLNDSTGKFSLYQTIATAGAWDIEYFMIADKHYLAIANYLVGANSAIYQWNGHQFVAFQSISTNGATSFKFFKISQELFIAVTNMFAKSAIYKWIGNQFEKFQEIGTKGITKSTAFVVNSETFLAFSNIRFPSTVFKWSGNGFVKLQSVHMHGAKDVKSFNIDGDTFLAFANWIDKNLNTDSFIYKWNGSKFVLFQSIPTHGAYAWHPFVMCGQTFLGVANQVDDSLRFNIKSVIYLYVGEQFIQYQEISTQGAADMTTFEFEGHTYLAIANSMKSGGYNINSTLYKWI